MDENWTNLSTLNELTYIEVTLENWIILRVSKFKMKI